MNIASDAIKKLLSKNTNEGTSHWIAQRLYSVLLVPLTIIFIINFGKNFRVGYEQNLLFYQNPFHAALIFLFISLSCYHFKQGMQVIIEDYIHDKRLHKLLLRFNGYFFWIISLVIFGALTKIVLEQMWSLE